MQSTATETFALTRPRLRLDSCNAFLRQLATDSPPWAELGNLAARDPLLSWSILCSLPLAGEIGDLEVGAMLENRLAQLGADLLRAWILQASIEASASAALEHRSAHSLLVAELALHLANEMGYPEPQEAYLAGLWHELGALFEDGDPAGIEDGNLVRRAEYSARIAARTSPGQPLLDAIRLQVETEDCIADGHALSRVLWVARVLADAQPDQRLSSLSRLVGLEPQLLLSLRADVTYLAEDAMRTPISGMSPMTALTARAAPQHDQSGPPAPPWIGTAVRGLMQGAFIELSEHEVQQRLLAACSLMTGAPGPQLVLEMQNERFMPLLTSSIARRWLAGLELRTDNPTSTLTLAIRRGEPVRYSGTHSGPGRSTLDWQLDRWLGCEGFSVWPWQAGGRKGVAIFSPSDDNSRGRPNGHRGTLLQAALGELLRTRRRIAERSAQEDAARSQFMERARRVRHEASSPLTLIRSYLELVRERHGDDEKTNMDLAVLGTEIDRVAHMLRGIAGNGQEEREPPFCQPNEVLRDLRTLCADTLFASRALQLDLRTAANLPPARIPRSVLRQILLNLVRNAAEAVPKGGRVSMSSSGPVSVDGRMCVEIRVIDSGPGLSEERLRNLFASGESDKGADHEGIGLTIVRDLLRQFNSALVCRSQPGAGTGMQIFIPAHA